MTIKERAELHAAQVATSSLEEQVEAALRAELEDLIHGLETDAKKTIQLYADLSLDGEREAAALRNAADRIKKRLGI